MFSGTLKLEQKVHRSSLREMTKKRYWYCRLANIVRSIFFLKGGQRKRYCCTSFLKAQQNMPQQYYSNTKKGKSSTLSHDEKKNVVPFQVVNKQGTTTVPSHRPRLGSTTRKTQQCDTFAIRESTQAMPQQVRHHAVLP